MCSRCPPPARTHLRRSRYWSIAASITFCSKSTQVCIKLSCRSQMSQTFVLYTHSLKLYNVQVHFDEAYTIHLMQFSLVISHCIITFSLLRLSQGSVATIIRRGGWSSYHHMCRSSLNLTVKTALKSVYFSRSYRQKYVGSFLWLTVY